MRSRVDQLRDQQHGADGGRRKAEDVGVKDDQEELEDLPIEIRSRISKRVCDLLLDGNAVFQRNCQFCCFHVGLITPVRLKRRLFYGGNAKPNTHTLRYVNVTKHAAKPISGGLALMPPQHSCRVQGRPKREPVEETIRWRVS